MTHASRPSREEFLEGRVRQQETTIAHLTALVHQLLDTREQRTAAPVALPPQFARLAFDPASFDPTDTLPAGIRADELMRLVGG